MTETDGSARAIEWDSSNNDDNDNDDDGKRIIQAILKNKPTNNLTISFEPQLIEHQNIQITLDQA